MVLDRFLIKDATTHGNGGLAHQLAELVGIYQYLVHMANHPRCSNREDVIHQAQMAETALRNALPKKRSCAAYNSGIYSQE